MNLLQAVKIAFVIPAGAYIRYHKGIAKKSRGADYPRHRPELYHRQAFLKLDSRPFSGGPSVPNRANQAGVLDLIIAGNKGQT